MLSLFAHPRKMRRRCLDNLHMPAESDTSRSEEDDALEGDEATGFYIKRGDNLPPVRSSSVLSFVETACTASSGVLTCTAPRKHSMGGVFSHLHPSSKPCKDLAVCFANVK